MTTAEFRRLATVIADVVAASARDARRSRLVVRDTVTPETALLVRCLAEGGSRLPLDRLAAPDAPGDGLVLGAANKTVAVLWPDTAPEPVLPLADLYASQVAALEGGWSAPDDARGLIDRVGGIDVVDAFLVEHLDRRQPLDDALRAISDRDAAEELRERLGAGWWWRRRLGLVPKLGARTLGIDFR